MHLRSNIALKLFALILFTLEFMAPAMITGLAPDEIASDKILLINSSNVHNPLFSIFLEELCENEESRESDRDSSTHKHISIASHRGNLLDSGRIAPIAFANSLLQFETHPPLYRAHRKLLI